MSRFHSGEKHVQESVGVRQMAERVGGSVYHALSEPAQAFLSSSSFAAITWFDTAHRIWITPLTGEAGFLYAEDEHTIVCDLTTCSAPAILEQQFSDAPGALVVMDFAARLRMRVNGRLESADGLILRVAEAYGNCPKYITRRRPNAAGEPKAAVAAVTEKSFLDERSIELINRSNTFFVGSYAAAGGADASHRGGDPGFVMADENTIRWTDFPGNNMFNTFGNFQSNPETALLFVDFQTRDCLAVTGEIERFTPSSSGRRAAHETVFAVKSAKFISRALAQSWQIVAE